MIIPLYIIYLLFNISKIYSKSIDINSAKIIKSIADEQKIINPNILRDFEEKLILDEKRNIKQKKYELGKCEINWGYPCPHQWLMKVNPVTDEIECAAPSSYIGFCKKLISFDGFSFNSKQEWSELCSVNWPCYNSNENCDFDYSQPCPIGFVVQADGHTCAPYLDAFSGTCLSLISFRGKSEAEKATWSEICSASWPCHRNCPFGINSICPNDWSHIGNYNCEASEFYKKNGKCDYRWNFKYYSDSMKKNFAQKCDVSWSCSSNCIKNYEALCPLGWTLIDGVCTAPENDANICSIQKQSFLNISVNDKILLEYKCRIIWPCKDRDKCTRRNWSLPCPEFWYPVINNVDMSQTNLILLDAYCKPRNPRSAKCYKEQAKNFSSMTENDRKKWASECEAPWPCEAIEDQTQPEIGLLDTNLVGPVHNKDGKIIYPFIKKPPPMKVIKLWDEEIPEEIVHFTYSPKKRGYYSWGHYLLGTLLA